MFRIHTHTRFQIVQRNIGFFSFFPPSPRVNYCYPRVVETGGSRGVSATRQPQQQHRSRSVRRHVGGTGEAMRRAASTQHFAEATIAYTNKVKGKRHDGGGGWLVAPAAQMCFRLC